MKSLIDKFDGSDFNKEEISKLKIKYLEICARIRHSQKYSIVQVYCLAFMN